jgi:phage tail sheath protein FI
MTVSLTGDQVPGIYLQEVFPPPAPSLLTGVPAFLGYPGPAAQPDMVRAPQPLTLWPQFQAGYGPGPAGGFLASAVRGFFANGGLLCYVVALDPTATPLVALQTGLAALADIDAVDLVCAPDIMSGADQVTLPDPEVVAALQAEVLADCQGAVGRFAILDAVLTADTGTVMTQRGLLHSADGALYHPWLWAPGDDGQPVYLPPCGHVAGIYSRSDQQTGAYKAPANQALDGVLDLRVNLPADEIGRLYADGVNCLRALPGRGIRVWGASTLSDDPAWRPVAARRVFGTMARWLEQFMTGLAYEPNDVRLWVRIMRELTAYLDGLFQGGALLGRSPEEAFFVKCDSETNPPEVTDAGLVVTSVGVALAAPAEFVIVRIIHGTSGVTIQPASATA